MTPLNWNTSSFISMMCRSIIPFMTNSIIFTDIGGDAQVRVGSGNLFMAMSNDRWIELHPREIDGGVSSLTELDHPRFFESQVNTNVVVVANSRRSRNPRITRWKRVKSELPTRSAQHRLVKVTSVIERWIHLYNFLLVAVPTKRKKNATPSEIPKHGTIDTFFKKTKSASSLPTQPELVEIAVIERTCKATTEDIKANYVKCPKCDVALPKANLFIHQIRCTK